MNTMLAHNEYQETVQKKIREIEPNEKISMQRILADLVKTTIHNVEIKNSQK